MKHLIRLLASAVALLITAYLVPGFVVQNFWSALVSAFVLGIVNMTVKPIMLLVTLPLNFLTLGLFTFVVNALMLALTSVFVPGFDILGVAPALAGAVVLAIVSTVISMVIQD